MTSSTASGVKQDARRSTKKEAKPLDGRGRRQSARHSREHRGGVMVVCLVHGETLGRSPIHYRLLGAIYEELRPKLRTLIPQGAFHGPPIK